MSISVGNTEAPTLDGLASDALDLRNAAVVTRIILEHCLAVPHGTAYGTYKTFNLLPQQIESVFYSMGHLEDMCRDLAAAMARYHLAGMPR